MKAVAFLSLSATIRSRSRHHYWIAETQRRNNHLHLPPLSPTLQLTSTHHHAAVTSRWLTISSLLCSSSDEYESNLIDDDRYSRSSKNEVPSIIRCNAQNNSNIHIYQMNAAALQHLFMKEKQTRDDIAGQSCTNDSFETNSGNCSTESSSTSILERVLNCTTAVDDTSSTSMSQYYEPEVYFVAVSNNTEISHDNDNNLLLQSTMTDLESTTIMGVITIQLRNKSPLIAGPSTPSTPITTDNSESNSHDDPSSSSSNDLPAVTLPTPHFYICNVQVEQQFRQQGIGTSLLHAIVEYCKGYHVRAGGDQQKNNDDGKKKRLVGSNGYIQSNSSSAGNKKEQLLQKLRQRQQNRRNKAVNMQHPSSKSIDDDTTIIPIVLSVDTYNIPAVRLYEKFGFEYLEQNDVFCMMVLYEVGDG